MCHWWADNRHKILENLVCLYRSVLDVQGGQRKPATKEVGYWTKVARRTNKGPEGRGEQRRIMAVQDHSTPSLSSWDDHLWTISWGHVVNGVSLAPLSKKYEPDLFFMDSGTIAELATLANKKPQSDASLCKTRTLSWVEAGIMRPSLLWKESIVGWHHNLPDTTFHPNRASNSTEDFW